MRCTTCGGDKFARCPEHRIVYLHYLEDVVRCAHQHEFPAPVTDGGTTP